MDFPLIGLMDERACYEKLLVLLRPDGLACPRCGAGDRLGVHRRHRDPVLDYQCGHWVEPNKGTKSSAMSRGNRFATAVWRVLRHLGQHQAKPSSTMCLEGMPGG